VKLIRTPINIKCVMQSTESFNTAFDFITDLNQSSLIRNSFHSNFSTAYAIFLNASKFI